MSNDADPYRGAFQQRSAPAVPARPPGPRRGPVSVEDTGPQAAGSYPPAPPASAPRWGEAPAAQGAPTEQFAVEDGYFDAPEPSAVSNGYPAANTDDHEQYGGSEVGGWEQTDYDTNYEQPGYLEPEVFPGAPTAAVAADMGSARSRPAAAPVVYERPVPAVRETYLPSTEVALGNLETRGKQVPAKQGWRGMLHAITRLNVSPGKDEVYELSLQERVRRIVRTTFPIAVVSVKGGVGRTVVTETLAAMFSATRGDRVIAVDLDPDDGNLIERHGRESALSISDLVADGSLTRYLDVRAHTSQDTATRLEVLAGPDYVRTEMPLRRTEFEAVMPILKEHYSLALMDTGRGLKTNLMLSILAQSRALVVVSSASIDALMQTETTLEWLRANGYQQLLDSVVLVINNTQRGKPNVDVDKAVERFSRQVRPERIFVLPYDRHIAEGKKITLELLSATTRRRYLEMAAVIADLFPKVAG